LFIQTADTLYWHEFQKEISVPIGDSLARVELSKGGDTQKAKKGFIQGRNKEEDAGELIWLFVNFKNISFMKEAISIWKEGDFVIGQTALLGTSAYQKVMSGKLTEQEKNSLIEQVISNTVKSTKFERQFLEVLGSAARKINTYLFYFNLVMTFLMLGSTSFYAFAMIERLNQKNEDLAVINHELDKFLYSASHDLRAPISSLKGLIQIAELEGDGEKIKGYLTMMNTVLDKQDNFIKEIIDFSRNKRTHIFTALVNLPALIQQAITNHQYMPGAESIKIEKVITVETIYSDPLRLEIVLNNLVSNAIKYSDKSKENKFINLKVYKHLDQCVIEISDNGIGIDQAHLPFIFDMFFVTDHSEKGSGLGLYITKETVHKLNGSIGVESVKKHGTVFTIKIPGNRQEFKEG
jgi:signal transduction histidine kinase